MAYIPLQVTIPEPCHENWNDMTPAGNHQRHCDSCAKNVTNFTWMTDREVHQFLTEQGGGCGRFRPDQLNRPIRRVISPTTGWRAAAAAGGLLLSTGLAAGTQVDSIPPSPTLGFVTMSTIINQESETKGRAVGTISGTVIDSANGDTLMGASIWLKGTTLGTVSDIDGRFELKHVRAGSTLVVSYLGYTEKEILIAKDDMGYGELGLCVELTTGTTELPVCEVTGYTESLKGEMMISGGIRAILVSSHRNWQPEENEIPTYFQAASLSPNPFVDRLVLEMKPPAAGHISAELFTATGRRLRK